MAKSSYEEPAQKMVNFPDLVEGVPAIMLSAFDSALTYIRTYAATKTVNYRTGFEKIDRTSKKVFGICSSRVPSR